MKLSAKNYKKIKLAMVVVLAIVFSQSIIQKNFFIPVILLIVSSLVLLYLRSQVNEVVADERDYATAGKSAVLAIQVYAWLAVICMFLLYSLSDLNPYYYAVAMTLAFSTTILMLLYATIFRYYNKFKFSDKKLIYSAVVLIIFMFMAVLTLRIFSGEDGWICENGKWVKHGNPSFEAPRIECR